MAPRISDHKEVPSPARENCSCRSFLPKDALHHDPFHLPVSGRTAENASIVANASRLADSTILSSSESFDCLVPLG